MVCHQQLITMQTLRTNKIDIKIMQDMKEHVNYNLNTQKSHKSTHKKH